MDERAGSSVSIYSSLFRFFLSFLRLRLFTIFIFSYVIHQSENKHSQREERESENTLNSSIYIYAYYRYFGRHTNWCVWMCSFYATIILVVLNLLKLNLLKLWASYEKFVAATPHSYRFATVAIENLISLFAFGVAI